MIEQHNVVGNIVASKNGEVDFVFSPDLPEDVVCEILAVIADNASNAKWHLRQIKIAKFARDKAAQQPQKVDGDGK